MISILQKIQTVQIAQFTKDPMHNMENVILYKFGHLLKINHFSDIHICTINDNLEKIKQKKIIILEEKKAKIQNVMDSILTDLQCITKSDPQVKIDTEIYNDSDEEDIKESTIRIFNKTRFFMIENMDIFLKTINLEIDNYILSLISKITIEHKLKADSALSIIEKDISLFSNFLHNHSEFNICTISKIYIISQSTDSIEKYLLKVVYNSLEKIKNHLLNKYFHLINMQNMLNNEKLIHSLFTENQLLCLFFCFAIIEHEDYLLEHFRRFKIENISNSTTEEMQIKRLKLMSSPYFIHIFLEEQICFYFDE